MDDHIRMEMDVFERQNPCNNSPPTFRSHYTYASSAPNHFQVFDRNQHQVSILITVGKYFLFSASQVKVCILCSGIVSSRDFGTVTA